MKKLSFLFALLCASVMGWADTEKFVAANASLFYKDGGGTKFYKADWTADETSSASYNNATGVISATIGTGVAEGQWRAQIHLTHGVTFTSSKKYVFSCDITTTNPTNNITIKVCDAQERLYKTDFSTTADVAKTYSGEFTSQGNETSPIVFDFGFAEANTNITISNISIVEKEAAPVQPVSYCDYEAEHVASHSADSRVLISLEPTANTNEYKMTVKTNSTKKLDYLYVTATGNSPSPATAGTDDNGDEFEEMSVTFTNSNASASFYIAWSNPNWDGRWDYNLNNVNFSDLVACGSAGGAANPHLTLTNPTKSSVLLPKGESVTVAYTSENTAAASVSSPDAYVSISGNVVTAESTGTATVTVSQAAVEDTWKAASVSFEVNAFDWNDISFIASSDYKFKASSNSVSLDNAILSRSGHNCIHLILPNAVGLSCSLTGNHEFDGAGLFIYTDVFTVRQTPFTVTCDGNTYDCYVYYNLDETPPTISNVAVTSYTHESAVITITANETFVSAEVFNNGVSMGTFTPSEGAITITGLTASTTYNQLTVKVKDAANNWSSAAIVPEFTTAATPSIAPKTYNGYAYSTDKHVFIKYTITRTSELNLTFSIVREVQGITGAANPYVFIGGIEQGQMTGSNGSFTYTKTGPFADDAELAISFKTPYAGGDNFVNFNYIVASEQAEPTYPVGAVALNKYASTLSVGGTDNLSATAYPSFATNAGAISWNSDATSYATVDAGTVTAVAAGSAKITATCGDVTSSPCVVTVVAALEEAKYYGMGTFSDYSEAKNAFAYEYCFTRSSNNEVTLDVVFSKDMTGIISNDNFKIYINLTPQGMTYDAETKTASYAFGAQTEGTGISYYFYFIMAGGVHQTPSVTYTVGSSNDKVYACVMDENIDNTSVLTAYNGRTAQVILDRTFAKDAGHYTLVLPFDLDEDAVATKLPGTLTELSDSYLKPNEDLKLNFVDVTSMTAGKAYLYLPSQAVANPVFENVTIKSALVTTDTEKADFIGIYAPMTIVDLQGISNSYVLGADNYLYESSQVSTTDGDMKALRAYFTLDFPAQSSVQGRRPRAMVVFNEPRTDMPTDVEDVEQVAAPVKRIENGQLIIEKNGRLYNAQGQVIR